jgi:hypothetical protein
MSVATAAEPILLDLDEKTWEQQIDRTEAWLGNVLLTQEKFRKHAADTTDKIREPHIKEYLREVTARARAHEEEARKLFRAIGRKPSTGRSLVGAAAAKTGEALADVVGLAGGAHGNWKDLRELLLEGLDALGAFAIVEQLGYALGLPELAEPAFRIVAEKQKDQLLIEEYLLEMGPVAILLHDDA